MSLPTDPTRSLLEAYRSAIYRVDLGKDWSIALEIDRPSAPLARWLAENGVERWGIVTAHNPASERLSLADNEERAARLTRRLGELGLPSRPSVGLDPRADWPAEAGHFIWSTARETLRSLAREFGQTAIVVGTEAATPALLWIAEEDPEISSGRAPLLPRGLPSG